MAWRPLLLQNFLGKLTVSEYNMLVNASGASSIAQTKLSDAIAMFDSAMIATGFNVAPQPNMVDSLRQDVLNYALWDFLIAFPKLEIFKTQERKAAYDRACDKLKQVANRLAGAIEDPAGYQSNSNNWNSSQKLLGRMWPVTPPLQQWSIQGSPYPQEANQNATSVVALSVTPAPPKNMIVTQSSTNIGQLVLYWIQPSNAMTYSVYRGLTSGGESATPIATLLYGNTYTDTDATIGTQYFYYVTATNEIGTSAASNENFNTPINALAPPSPFAPYYFV